MSSKTWQIPTKIRFRWKRYSSHRGQNDRVAGFTRRDDLSFLLKTILGKDYVHLTKLTPTQEILKAYRDSQRDWARYERDFLALLECRRVELTVPKEILDGGCLLCSEATSEYCHRRLAAEYLAAKWLNVFIEHLI